ncbi:rod shape-determining protein RodA [Luteimonas vadosa]|uniref:Peptidoglycan glycosyltransferase MrdB n=1 Tax=Luteimonas vadosa TaxID=1165507 RepID=A0ABP9DQ98_9GAMM
MPAPTCAGTDRAGVNVILQWLLEMAERFTRTLDWTLCVALLALMAIGLAVLYSAGNQNEALVVSQAARYGVGLAVMWALSRIPPIRLREATPYVYALSLVPLVVVLFVGTGRSGQHWINLGIFYFQPAELMKLSLPMMAAWMLHVGTLPPRFLTTVATIAIIALPTGLILMQPDFGTAMLVASSGAFALFLAGLSWWWFIAAAAAVAAAAPAAWFWLLRPYQKDRILTFLDPESDPLGTGWNIIQSKIAIGSGGLTGQGWGKGSQSHLDYVPEHTTDFIFAVLSEEFGWLGVATVLALYLFVIGRCLWIASEARSAYSRLLAGSLGLAFFVYVVVNGGMISGLLPVVGVPMPLLSFGGTAAVSLLAGLGVVMAVRAHRPTRR